MRVLLVMVGLAVTGCSRELTQVEANERLSGYAKHLYCKHLADEDNGCDQAVLGYVSELTIVSPSERQLTASVTYTTRTMRPCKDGVSFTFRKTVSDKWVIVSAFGNPRCRGDGPPTRPWFSPPVF